MSKKHKRINNDIRAKNVRLIDEQGEVIGEMSLQEALTQAKEQELDLMELKNDGDFSIVKLLDYGKFLYKQKKQEQKSKQKGKAPDVKTIKITFKIGDHDLEVKRKQAQKFASLGHPLKVMLQLRGRENAYHDLANEKMTYFIELLGDFYKADKNITKSGNTYTAMLSPK